MISSPVFVLILSSCRWDASSCLFCRKKRLNFFKKMLAIFPVIPYNIFRRRKRRPDSPIAQPVEHLTVNQAVAGSNPARGANGAIVKRLRHRPFTAGSWVRIPLASPWAISSDGRALALQARCQQFDPVIAHHEKMKAPLQQICCKGAFCVAPAGASMCVSDDVQGTPSVCCADSSL